MPDRTMHPLITVLLGFAIRHLAATLVTVAAACALWTLVYFGLLAWAIVTDGGMGGPLAYPGFLILLSLASAAASLLLYLPATGAAELVCRRRGLPILAQIPVSVAFLALLCPIVALIIRSMRSPIDPTMSTLSLAVWLFGLSLIPIGLYWWVAQSVPLIRSLLRKLFARNVATAPDKIGGR